MSASSAVPIAARLRSPSTRWSVTTSDARSSSSRPASSAPAARARSAVRFGLQASTRMPNAAPTAATRLPRRPSPITPSVAPSSARPGGAACQRPSRRPCACAGRWRASARMSAHVRSVVGAPAPGAPQTVTPRSAQAARSIEALRRPVVTSSRSAGRRSIRERGKGVRSRIATSASNGARRSATASSSATWSENASTASLPAGAPTPPGRARAPRSRRAARAAARRAGSRGLARDARGVCVRPRLERVVERRQRDVAGRRSSARAISPSASHAFLGSSGPCT